MLIYIQSAVLLHFLFIFKPSFQQLLPVITFYAKKHNIFRTIQFSTHSRRFLAASTFDAAAPIFAHGYQLILDVTMPRSVLYWNYGSYTMLQCHNSVCTMHSKGCDKKYPL